ncbi:hypothetical protein CBL_01724 [Carabus blaptoides fortunei]
MNSSHHYYFVFIPFNVKEWKKLHLLKLGWVYKGWLVDGDHQERMPILFYGRMPTRPLPTRPITPLRKMEKLTTHTPKIVDRAMASPRQLHTCDGFRGTALNPSYKNSPNSMKSETHF